jgi:hypothetical protein
MDLNLAGFLISRLCERIGKEAQQVGGYQRVLADAFTGEVSR